MKVLKRILNEIRCFMFMFPLLVIGVIVAPLVVIFNWTGFWVLCIANLEFCSLAQARKLLMGGKKYKYNRFGLGYTDDYLIENYHSQNADFGHTYQMGSGSVYRADSWSTSSASYDSSQTTNQAFSYRPDNVFHYISK